MKRNKYFVYSIISAKSLVTKQSMILGLIMTSLLGVSIAIILTLFDINISPLIEAFTVEGDEANLTYIKVISIVISLLVIANVSAIMQSVINDRESKLSEIIGTSIYEKQYIAGKIFSSFVLMFSMVLNMSVALILAAVIYFSFSDAQSDSLFELLSSLLSSIDFFTLILYLLLMLIMIITTILFTLLLSIKIENSQEAAPTALVILLPFIIMLVLFVVIPNDFSIWENTSQVLMFIPIISIPFAIFNIYIAGMTFFNIFAIFVSVIYLISVYFITKKVYKIAFYNVRKYKFIELIKLIVKKEKTYAEIE